MTTKTVYLAGPITGLTYAGSTDWRKYAAANFLPGIRGLSPMRAKEYLASLPVISADLGSGYDVDHPIAKVLSGSRGIMTRDYFDCSGCNVVLANLLGATEPSLGTTMEMAWCYGHRVPLVVAMEPEGNPHEHPMLREAFGYRVETLDKAITVVNAILGAYVGDGKFPGQA